MDVQLQLSFSKLDKALQSLEAMVLKPMQADRSNIDACIQRFEFSIELYWKLLKKLLQTKGKDVVYPRDILREAYEGGLISDEKLWLRILLDRNQTSHTYDESLADRIYVNIKEYYPEMRRTYQQLLAKFSAI